MFEAIRSLRPGQQLAEVMAVAEHQVADDDLAPAIPQRLESQIEREARAWGVHVLRNNVNIQPLR